MSSEWLSKQLETIRNLVEIAFVLQNVGKNELLPTVLEYMLKQCQQIVDENCVLGDS